MSIRQKSLNKNAESVSENNTEAAAYISCIKQASDNGATNKKTKKRVSKLSGGKSLNYWPENAWKTRKSTKHVSLDRVPRECGKATKTLWASATSGNT